MKKYLLVMSCSATKREAPGRIPASQRYNGKAYQVIHKAIRKGYFPTGHLDILIISAKFGLINWDDEIENYDKKMKKARAEKLRPEVQQNLSSSLEGKVYEEVFIYMGAKYRPTLEGFEWRQHTSDITCSQGHIGEQLSQLKAWIKAIFLYGGDKIMINPKQLAQASLSLLEEAVLAILFIGRPHYLKLNEIANRLGIERDYSFTGNNYLVIRGLIHKLEKEGRVEPESDKRAKWGLTESEIKARSS